MKPIFSFRRPAVDTIPLSALRFKRISLADMPLINKLLQNAGSRTCDYTIGGLYMWIAYFGYEYCVLNDTLFIKGRTENKLDETAFCLPVGALPLRTSVGMIQDYCALKGIPTVFSAVPADRLDELLDILGDDARVENLEGWSDYLYDISSLATFSGKHMMKKRNHVNRFLADNPHWKFEALTYDLIPEVSLFFAGQSLAADTDSAPAIHERNACAEVLANFSSYPFEAAVLRDESGEIAAFTVGEVIGDTLYVHIEKINHEISGAGAAICKLFASYMMRRYPQLRYVNREEDCGDEGLRAAKMAYHPTAILQKYNVR